MSIVKMKKLRVFGMAADREQLLEELQHLGCVELSDCGDKLTEPDWQSLTRPDDRGAAEKKGTLTLLNSALNVLGKYAKEKGTLLRRRPVLTEGQLFDKEAQKRALAAAEELTKQEKKIAALYSEESKLKNQKLSLLPFMELDVALDEPSTDEVSVTFGSLPLKKPRNGPEIPLEEALAAVTDLVSITMAGKDQELQSLLVICHREVEESVFEVLKQYGFARSTLRDFSGTARENIARLDQRLAGTAAELESAKAAIVAQAPA
ncbi:MAG: V-type ATP synthase subunit I, partial [Oscillospiraceae bacterium]